MKKEENKPELPNVSIETLIKWHYDSIEILGSLVPKQASLISIDDELSVTTDTNNRAELINKRLNVSYFIAEQTKRYNNKKEIYIKY